MNKLEQFLEEIKELSNPDNIDSTDEMSKNLEIIHELTVEFYDEIYELEHEE